jgi:hypothetical protein
MGARRHKCTITPIKVLRQKALIDQIVLRNSKLYLAQDDNSHKACTGDFPEDLTNLSVKNLYFEATTYNDWGFLSLCDIHDGSQACGLLEGDLQYWVFSTSLKQHHSAYHLAVFIIDLLCCVCTWG